MYKLFLLFFLAILYQSCKKNTTGIEPSKLAQEYDIIYVSNRTGTNQLYKFDMNGENEKQLTNDTHNYFHPTFSSDGSKLVFYSENSGNDEIYTMNPNGEDLKNISDSPSNDNLCQFSNDGSKVVFTSNRDGNREIYIMNSDGSNQNRLTYNNFIDHSPRFSPDDMSIIFYQLSEYDSNTTIANYDIFKIDISGENLQQLTPDNTYFHRTSYTPDYSYGVYDAAPIYSPDGKKICFNTYFIGQGFDILIMNSDGSDIRRITNEIGWNTTPVFYPFDSKILFRSHRYANFDLFLMNYDGSNQTVITPNTNHVYFSDISPDGSKILFYDNNDIEHSLFKYKVYIMDSDGSNRKMLSQSSWYHHDIFPIFQPVKN